MIVRPASTVTNLSQIANPRTGLHREVASSRADRRGYRMRDQVDQVTDRKPASNAEIHRWPELPKQHTTSPRRRSAADYGFGRHSTQDRRLDDHHHARTCLRSRSARPNPHPPRSAVLRRDRSSPTPSICLVIERSWVRTPPRAPIYRRRHQVSIRRLPVG